MMMNPKNGFGNGSDQGDRGRLIQKLDLLPESPGVYMFKNAAGQIIYVGKAGSLRVRVRSYFRGGRHLTERLLRLVREVADIDHIVTGNEIEALILECNLIKRYRPRFNIRLRDDKNYPFLRVDTSEPWPRVTVVRRMRNDGARYFGPFTRAGAMYETLRALRRAFPYRTCGEARFRRHRERPCLHYHIQRCLGPCAALCSPEAYTEMVRQMILTLEGRQGELRSRLRRDMEEAADKLEFERAAAIRDRLNALRQVSEKQAVVSDRLADHDVIALARDPGEGDEETACAQIFFVREGKVVGREVFFLAETADAGDGEVLAAFLKQFYGEAGFIPAEILLGTAVDERESIESWLGERRGSRVRFTVPRRGEKRRLVGMVSSNAAQVLEEERGRRADDAERAGKALEEVRAALSLPFPPRRIECYDISNTQGRQAVGSMVVFTDGRPAKGEYRRFRVRSVEGPDDYRMLREVLARRFRRTGGVPDGPDPDAGSGFDQPPDLILIDGGRGQLQVALEVLEEAGLAHIPAFGLAKENEWLYAAGRPEPIILPRRSAALRLLQHLRDEAHRFAIGYHRKLRSRAGLASLLEEVPGIGPRRRKAITKHFGSLKAVGEASVDELAAVPGLNRALAEEVRSRLDGFLTGAEERER